MAIDPDQRLVELTYAEAARDYLRKLPLEHHMEAIAQATQRKITLESFDLVHARRPDIQTFNELLIQKRVKKHKKRKMVQVVPDNMVVVWHEPIEADGSYDVPLQPVGPFWVLECVSKSSKRKDYERNRRCYERVFAVPYYLTYYPDAAELILRRLEDGKYVIVQPNENDRYAIPELEMELALLDGWVRFWFRGELLPLPADLQRELDDVRRQLEESQRQAAEAQRKAEEAQRQAAEAQRKAEEAQRQAAEAQRKAEEAQRQADEARQQAKKSADQFAEERRARLVLEQELARLRGQTPPSAT